MQSDITCNPCLTLKKDERGIEQRKRSELRETKKSFTSRMTGPMDECDSESAIVIVIKLWRRCCVRNLISKSLPPKTKDIWRKRFHIQDLSTRGQFKTINGLFAFIFVFSKVNSKYKHRKNTADLWCQKQPLCQLYHNHFRNIGNFYIMNYFDISLHHLNFSCLYENVIKYFIHWKFSAYTGTFYFKKYFGLAWIENYYCGQGPEHT